MKNIENIYSVVLNNIDISVIIFAIINEKIVYVNNRTCRILGFSENELLNRNITDIILSGRREKIVFNELISSFNKKSVIKDFYIIKKNGEEINPVIKGNRIKLESGIFYQIDFAVQESMYNLNKGSSAADRYIKILDLIPYGIVEINETGNIIYANKTFTEMYCCSFNEIEGNSFFDLLDNENDKNFLMGCFGSSGFNINDKRNIFEIRKKDGSIFQVNMYWDSLKDFSGETTGFLGIITEITDDMRAGMALKDLINEFDKSKKDLEQFTIAVSHDLQEPLNTAYSFIELLKKESESVLKDKSRHYFARIEESVKRMQSMIGELLILSKIPWDSKSLIKIDLKSILRDVVNDLELLIKETSAKIEISEMPYIRGIPTHIHRLFMNIIGNSIKFRRKESDPVIKIYSEKDDSGTVKIFIEDNGIGFESYQSDQIFNLFKRLNPKSKYEGSGIGLAICRKIMELHNGRIEARKNSESGSTFILTF